MTGSTTQPQCSRIASLALVAISALILSIVAIALPFLQPSWYPARGAATGPIPIPANSPMPTNNDGQAEMLKQFRLASEQEAALLQSLPTLKYDSAAQHIYVAVAPSVKLVPVDAPMVLILPNGHRWESGPMSFITLLRVPTTSANDLMRMGTLFSDPLCTAQRAGTLKGNCLDPAIQQPGVWSEMIKRTRMPTEEELMAWQGSKYVKNSSSRYLVATSDFIAAPQYTFDLAGPYTGPVGIFVPPGIHVLGGQLGFMDLYPVGHPGDKPDLVSLDSICFMYAANNETGRPSTFAPDSELKRVQSCTR